MTAARRRLRLALLGLALLGWAPETPAAAASARIVVHDAPSVLPELTLRGRDGPAVTLESFRGRAVLLDLWASWCLPCRVEAPSLDRLQARVGRARLAVLAVSIDRLGWPAVERFRTALGIRHLDTFLDDERTLIAALGVRGVPTALVIDADGREVARVEGGLDWEGEEGARLLALVLPPGG